MSRLLLPTLLAVAAASAGSIAWDVLSAPAAAPALPVPSRASATTAAPPWGVTPEEVAALLSRPPFSPTRRPDPTDGAALAGLPVLSGILVTQADRRAIFSGTAGGRPAVVQVGNQIGAYRVEAISPTDVTLAGPDGRRTVAPTFSSAPPPARALPNGVAPGFAAAPPAMPPMPPMPPPPPMPAASR